METPISDSGGGHRGNEIYSSRSPSVPSSIPIKDIYNTEGKLGSINGGIYGKTTPQVPMSRQVVEIPFWLHRDKPPKWISGINRTTTCRDVLLSIVRASHSNSKADSTSQSLLYTETDVFLGKLVLVEEWKGVVKPLSPTSRILKIWSAWGEERSHVRFIIKRASTSSNRNVVDNVVASNVPTQKNLVHRNPSVNQRLESVPKASTGTARTRRKVRRRNSTSSVGSRQSIDEMHPKALNELDSRYKSSDSQHHKQNILVPSSKNGIESKNYHIDIPIKDGENHHGYEGAPDDNFDQHLEEMMRVIVAQGRLIYDQLQRFNDKNTSSSKFNSPSQKVKVQAQVHLPLQTPKESDSATSSNYDSTSTSTSTAPRRDELFQSSNQSILKKKSPKISRNADFIRHPNNGNKQVVSNLSVTEESIPQRSSSLGYRSKSYDNYETIFPITTSQNLKVQENVSVDQLPITTTSPLHNNTGNQLLLEKSNSVSTINTILPQNNVQKIPSSSVSSVAGFVTENSSQSSVRSSTSGSKEETTSLNGNVEPKKNIFMKQTSNSDFQIVDITNVSDSEKEKKSNSSNSDSFHNNSFSSSSASESAMANSQLLVRGGSGGIDQLNQSVDLMNLSVLGNVSNAADFALYGYLNGNRKTRVEGSRTSVNDGIDSNEAETRFKRDKLILKTIHSELTKLVQMNDSLAFAEDSVDRLKIAIRQVQELKQPDSEPLDTERPVVNAPNLSMSEKEAEEHIACAKEQLERLKIANDDASKLIEKNRGSIEDIDKKVKAGKATLKHLEYDVNVIEKESRKLNKELEKVLKIQIDVKSNAVEPTSTDISNNTQDYAENDNEKGDVSVLSDSLDISVCTEDVTIMSRISADNSNNEDSVDSSTMFPELLQLDNSKSNGLIQNGTESFFLKPDNQNSSNSMEGKSGGPNQLLPISTDINIVHRVGCYEDMRMAINGSPAGSGASSSGNSSDKSVRFSDTEIIHPHHEYNTSSSSMTPDLPDLPDQPASRGSYTTAMKNGCNSSIMSLLAKSSSKSSIGKPILKSQRTNDGKKGNGANGNADVDTDNSDTGLSSLHSSSDEATFDAGTLV